MEISSTTKEALIWKNGHHFKFTSNFCIQRISGTTIIWS
jgi:hypothetical protein